MMVQTQNNIPTPTPMHTNTYTKHTLLYTNINAYKHEYRNQCLCAQPYICQTYVLIYQHECQHTQTHYYTNISVVYKHIHQTYTLIYHHQRSQTHYYRHQYHTETYRPNIHLNIEIHQHIQTHNYFTPTLHTNIYSKHTS